MKIDCIADLHGYYPKLEGGDLLIIAGDLTASDDLIQYEAFFDWLTQQDYQKSIIIAGNHDVKLSEGHNPVLKFEDYGMSSVEYLCDSGTEYNGLKIWGSPWSPYFKNVNPDCMAFMLKDEALFDKWMMIPKRTDILVTHCPAYGTLDYRELEDGTKYHMGSKTLENWIKYVERPLIHAFGHIHECGGMQAEEYATYNDKMMKSINCSYVNEKYKPVNKQIRIEL